MIDEVTQADVYAAAIQWCGEKDRETSMGDIRYFQENWQALPGLRQRIETLARHRLAAEAPLRAEIARLREALKDPNAVHVNLLRGDIARPTVHQMIHIYSPAKVRDGLETYARAALAQETGDD